jgi:hypothetical protein
MSLIHEVLAVRQQQMEDRTNVMFSNPYYGMGPSQTNHKIFTIIEAVHSVPLVFPF